MIKAIVRRSALVLSLAVLAAPMGNIYAQSAPTPSAVTGGDPQPTGEAVTGGDPQPTGESVTARWILLLSTLSSAIVS